MYMMSLAQSDVFHFNNVLPPFLSHSTIYRLKEMVLLSLICALVKRGRVFSVDIDNIKSVGHLKKAIKEGTSVIIQSPARKLQLFLAKKDEGRGAWLTETEVKQGAWSTSGLTLL
ncbi:hypothetical protein KXD40_001006 [Peronospora effusa]|nr:hypothetical protein KXD40_001006 [Peronospora effusa]CAI5724262.1 unnamed protein product [Peronospora effusa]